MSIQEYLSEMKKIYSFVLAYIEDEGHSVVNYSDLIKLFDKFKIGDTFHKLKLLLHLLLKISTNTNRSTGVISKIEAIIKHFKDQIIKYFPNWEIFNIFKGNKRILLFLIEEDLIKMDNYILAQITNWKYGGFNYPEYFMPEIKPFVDKKFIQKHIDEDWAEKVDEDLPQNFYEKRKIGENDSIICELIRSDSVSGFSSYVKNNNFSLSSKIEPSIFETNSFLLKNGNTELIEYAVFNGSNKIFNYLRENGVDLKPSLWKYAIHGKNAEIIHLLGENNIEPEDKSYEDLFKESIKCHHNEIANYFLCIFMKDDKESARFISTQCLKYYNAYFMKKKFINSSSFHELSEYDYYFFIYILLQNKELDINILKHKKIKIQNQIFQLHSKSNISIPFKIKYFNRIQNQIFQ